jgi:hypothetical protein
MRKFKPHKCERCRLWQPEAQRDCSQKHTRYILQVNDGRRQAGIDDRSEGMVDAAMWTVAAAHEMVMAEERLALKPVATPKPLVPVQHDLAVQLAPINANSAITHQSIQGQPRARPVDEAFMFGLMILLAIFLSLLAIVAMSKPPNAAAVSDTQPAAPQPAAPQPAVQAVASSGAQDISRYCREHHLSSRDKCPSFHEYLAESGQSVCGPDDKECQDRERAWADPSQVIMWEEGVLPVNPPKPPAATDDIYAKSLQLLLGAQLTPLGGNP